MNNLSSYLQKFRIALGDKTREKEVVQKTLLETCDISITLDLIDIRQKTAFCAFSPIERTEVSLKKKLVLQSLQERGLTLIDLK